MSIAGVVANIVAPLVALKAEKETDESLKENIVQHKKGNTAVVKGRKLFAIARY